ncbi:hypothetical protein [Massilia endophytica]|uniref:hypothetical protein n=1 Tax=Massilia endophytica TaxID=2899220 RepID=UPI001E2EA3FE|nr:hypothetical protein [Massilia endophytica]UGQ47510.1 hypothetical protein LSQ66_03230 [Massilia endophytica]
MAIKAVACAIALAACTAAQAAPSTFGTVVGNGLLCRDQISNAFFYDYLKSYFGDPYKREGGAWWFRAPDLQLWGMDVVELMVSDESYPYSFVGAVVDAAPDKLEEAIRQHEGLRFAQIGGSAAYPVREGNGGSRIVYVNNRSKIYCAKFKSMPPALR